MLVFTQRLLQLPLGELLLLVAVAGVTSLLVRRVLPDRLKNPGMVLIPLSTFALGLLYWAFAAPQPDVLAKTYLPQRSDDRGFVSSQTCRSCHPGEYASWHKTYHRTMTQIAGSATVVAGASQDFDERFRLETHGRSARLKRKGDEFWVDMVNPEWDKAQAAGIPEALAVRDPERVQRRVMLTTGSHHFQVYWITSDRTGELWQFPWRYHIGEDRWVHRNDVFLQPPDKPELSHFRTWNHQCIHCHNAGGEPGLGKPPMNLFSNTRVGEIGIACEACHGPAETHVNKYRNPGQRLQQRIASDSNHDVVNPAKSSPRMASQVCGQCHSHMVHHDHDRIGAQQFLKTGLAYRPGKDLDRFARFLTLDDGYTGNEHRFWADGNCRSGGREYNGLLASPCYRIPAANTAANTAQQHQLSCLSCHSMHNAPPNDQLKPSATSNSSCTACHPKFRQPEALQAHTHHQPSGHGSQCYNCHMPHTSYALFKAIRSHQIDSPRVTPTGPHTRPNACNLCHLDQTLLWTRDALKENWGNAPQLPPALKNYFGRDLERPAGAAWLDHPSPLLRTVAAGAYARSPLGKAALPTIIARLNEPNAYARMRFLMSVEKIIGRKISNEEYTLTGSTIIRQKQIEHLLKQYH